MKNLIPRIKEYYGETVEEVKKCSWPTKSELGQHTVLVIVGIIILTGFITVSDIALQYIVRGIYAIPNLIS
jgi:preprotein translocase subunit SecE